MTREEEKQWLRLEQVMACLLDHYLVCYDGNKDALATEAIELIPEWRQRMKEWHSKKENEA
jgi:hypothetical protein